MTCHAKNVRPVIRITAGLVAAAIACVFASSLHAARTDGTLTITAVDEKTQEPMAVRMELRDQRGRPVRIRPEGAIVAGDSLYFNGEVTLDLRRGAYTFLVEAGPEFPTRPGNFTIDRHAEDSAEVTLSRRVDMRKEGWWAGDLDVQVSLVDASLMMQARSIDFAPIAALVNDHGRCRKLKQPPGEDAGEPASAGGESPLLFGPWATLDDRRGGGLLAIGANPPVDVCQWKLDDPSLPSADAARDAGAQIVALTPFAWDLPIWIAAGKLDAVQVINRHSQQNAANDNEGAGRPRDQAFFPGKFGNGRYSEIIYHHLLNCGLRLPPTAGSGAGAPPPGRKSSPDQARHSGSASSWRTWSGLLGANRTYVHCGETFTRETWIEGLRAGRVVVTNGPLLRTRVDGELPGYTFELYDNERREFQIALDLAFYEANQVEYLEIVQNGKPIHQVRLDEFAKKKGKLPFVEFETSGWFLVRAVTNNPNVYQFASTGPFYVELNHEPRISRASVQFFLTWLDEAAAKFAGNAPVLAEIEAARPFWEKHLERANAD
ncbi:MAG: CehA/McbA family metallohydrolase [Pirellulales bacterium]|nr:CehA/McbA family metallohydrolase [Pirellulales bacterium]